MSMTRRNALIQATISGASLVVLSGCHSSNSRGVIAADGSVDAGPISDIEVDSISDAFAKAHSFLVVRKGDQVFALSSVCTHKGCRVRASKGDDAQFAIECPCHGSKFTTRGIVSDGPAERPLPRLAVEQNDAGHLIVHIERAPVAADADDASVDAG